MSSEEGPTWNEKEEFFRNSPKSIYFHELSKINEMKKKKRKKHQNQNLTPFCPKTREPDFSRTRGFRRKFSNNMLFHFKHISNEIN